MTLWPCLCRLACSGLLAPACWHCPPVVDCCFSNLFYFWEPRHWHHTSSTARPAMPLPLGQDAAAMACLCLLVATVSAGWLFFFINYNFLGTPVAALPGLLQCCCRRPVPVTVAIAIVFPIPSLLTITIVVTTSNCCCRLSQSTVAVDRCRRRVPSTIAVDHCRWPLLWTIAVDRCCRHLHHRRLIVTLLLLSLSLLLGILTISIVVDVIVIAIAFVVIIIVVLLLCCMPHAAAVPQLVIFSSFAVQRWTGFRTHFVYTSTSRILYPTKVDMIPITTFLVLMGTTGYVEKICHSSNL